MATTPTSAFVRLLAGVIVGACGASASAQDQPKFIRARGVATLDGLHALVERLGVFPGRKTVALFSEGLDLTSGCRGQFCDDRKGRFDKVIRAAALRNVAFYTFDAAGLRLMRMATGQLMEEPRAALSVLARETGGAFTDETNDLRPAVDRMRADTRDYYMIGFTTAMPESDRPRRLRVRVRRPGTTVLVRETYASTPPPVERAARIGARSANPRHAGTAIRAARRSAGHTARRTAQHAGRRTRHAAERRDWSMRLGVRRSARPRGTVICAARQRPELRKWVRWKLRQCGDLRVHAAR